MTEGIYFGVVEAASTNKMVNENGAVFAIESNAKIVLDGSDAVVYFVHESTQPPVFTKGQPVVFEIAKTENGYSYHAYDRLAYEEAHKTGPTK